MATPVFFMHDGAIDELICIPFLQSMPNISLSGIWITPSDCLGFPTATVCSQMLQFINSSTTALFLSDSSSQRPFPWIYRQYALMVNLLPLLNVAGSSEIKAPHMISGRSNRNSFADKSIFNVIKKENDKQGEATVFLVTSPLTDFVLLLEAIPELKSEIASIVWMGGSISAGGNIDTGIAIGANPNAEWNAYWDPFAVDTVLRSGIEINIFPLDVTNKFILTPDVLRQYFIPGAVSSQMLDLAAQMYALVAFQNGFSFWDTAAAAFLGNPGLFTMTQENINIHIDESDPNTFGCITVGGGYPVNIASTNQVTQFYQYLTVQLAGIK